MKKRYLSHQHAHININIKKSIFSCLILINRSSDEPSGGPGEDSLAGLRVHGLPNISSSRYILIIDVFLDLLYTVQGKGKA